jgi:hypothetical protein
MKDLPTQFRGIAGGLLLAAALTAPQAAAAQSLFANRGLGLVVQPTDARARGMGGVALGIEGADLTWANPADVVGIPAPGFKLAYQHDAFSSTYGSRESDGATARFPLVLGAFPIGGRAALVVGAAGFLDQNWAVEQRDTLVLGGDSVQVIDRFTSDGGVTQLRVGGGYRLLDQLVVGASLEYYLGGVRRGGARFFPGVVDPGCCLAEWTYSGAGATLGVEWRPSGALTVGTSASFGGALNAESADSLATNASFQIPTRIAAGASGRVSGNLLVGISGEWAGWSTLDDRLDDVGGARDVLSLHGGLEWDGAQVLGRPLPVRLGARRTGLPFSWGTPTGPSGWADETAVTGGLGMLLASGALRADLAAERGWRGGSDAGLEESFWRTTFSITVLGR